MAVRMRLVRLGRRHRAFFRLRVSGDRFATTGRFIEELGHVDPVLKDKDDSVVLKKDRIEHWLRQGAMVSPTVRSLLKKHGIGQPAPAQTSAPAPAAEA